jgi:hypothetical protein
MSLVKGDLIRSGGRRLSSSCFSRAEQRDNCEYSGPGSDHRQPTATFNYVSLSSVRHQNAISILRNLMPSERLYTAFLVNNCPPPDCRVSHSRLR